MRNLFAIIASIVLFASCVKDRTFTTPTAPNSGNRTLIDYWNFNSGSTTAPTISNVPGDSLHFDFATVIGTPDTTGYADLLSPVAPTENINAQNGDPAGNALRVRNPSLDFIISAPTTGYNNILVSYSEAKSSNGALTNTISYSLDGTNYIAYTGAGATYNLLVDPAYTLESFDFSSIAGANNNPHFKFKITFSGGNLATSGNDRFDNITIQGNSIGGGSAPVITSSATASGVVNTAFADTVTASNTPTSFSLVDIVPGGLTINSITGIITGTPTTMGTFVDTVKATNATGTGTHILTITINAAPTATVLHYWNFNATPNFIAPTTSIISGAGLSFDFTTVSSVTGYDDSLTASSAPAPNNPGGSSLNLQNSDTAGNALRVRNPCLDFIIAAPTTGYQNITLAYAAEASSASKAALTNTISYTLDGTNYITTGLSSTSYSLASVVDPAYALETFDFSSISGASNNANFKIKITFSSGNTNTSGNDRFDNITIKGIHL